MVLPVRITGLAAILLASSPAYSQAKDAALRGGHPIELYPMEPTHKHRSLLPKSFDRPSFRGYPISSCITKTDTGCDGKQAADKFCQSQTPSCGSASSFATQGPNSAPTISIGDYMIAAPGEKGSLASVVCDCQTIQARFEKPQVNGVRVDFCLNKQGEGGTNCGEPAATAFCKMQGYAKSPSYLIESSVAAPTVFLGDNSNHDTNPAGFSYIECGSA